ncbi:hypothetical protein KUV75_06295 [Qipengyuania gaetbuli]|uniref:hypothetical protein n=1 Tax=Qipengyuania gaetbuli TaxID=266952 RepID=UPI001C99856C|nr:hypothetical protein [Qipengyuania gaetbuli]MBY6014511.1 hypothetical protein [Qipengyuania gaetbuli]
MRDFKTLTLFALVTGASPLAAQSTDTDALIADALSAAPASVTDNASVRNNDGTLLREGSNGYTCYPQAPTMGPRCNDAEWDAFIAGFMKGEPYTPKKFGVSYMLAGEGTAPGTSNIDPMATEPTADNEWIKDGPHMMLIFPDPAMMAGLSTDPKDPVYVMWRGTPYAHVMVRIEEE